MFDPTSRYAQLPTLTWTSPSGLQLSYVSRRVLPQPDEYALLLLHTVTDSDRLDNITAQYLDDPTQFWRIADANNAMSPFDLTDEVGSTIDITLPQGIPGPSRA
jgi:hypothetical protein